MQNKLFAGIRLRLIAAYIDGTISALPITFLLWYAATSLSIPILVQRLFFLLIVWILFFIIINLLHEIFFTHYFGGPIGKLLTGLKVVNENGNYLSLKRSIFRHTVGYQFSAILFGLGFLAIIKDPQKQAWHDKAVGSKVIAAKKQWPLALFILLVLLISNLYIFYSAFNTALSGPLPSEFKSFIKSIQTREEKTPISTWQTYHNDKLGFELKYPASWQFEELDPNLSFGSILDSAGPQKDRLYITANGFNYTGIDNPDVVYKKEVFVGKKVTAQLVYQENKLISKGIEVPLATGFITIFTTPDSSGSFSAIDQILSTFRFVE